MERCNELCIKDAIGICGLCEALAERDRFERLWGSRRYCRKMYGKGFGKSLLSLRHVALFMISS